MTASKQSQDGIEVSGSGWLFKKKSITMHRNMNVKNMLINSDVKYWSKNNNKNNKLQQI